MLSLSRFGAGGRFFWFTGTPISSFPFRPSCMPPRASPRSTSRRSGISRPEPATESTRKAFARAANSLPGALQAANSGLLVTLRPGFTILSCCPISSASAAWRQRSKEVEERRLNVHVSPGGFPALVLNADFRPLSYYPLSLWSWQDAIKAVFLERVNIVANYDRAVHSPSLEMKLPSVVSLK